MARPLHLQFPSALFHVTARGDGREDIYLADAHRHRRFGADGVTAPSPWQDLRNQIYLGSERFVERMHAKIDPARPLQAIPQHQRRPVAKPLAH